MDKQGNPAIIELQVEKIGQLFDTLDPMPFREKDLDREAEDYILGWARELPRRLPIRILVHLPASEAASEQAQILKLALGRYFGYRADMASRDLSERFRIGRYSLVVGICVLALCIIGGRLVVQNLPQSQFGALLSEGLIILGWVANWRPIEIFLYDWWPIVRHRNLLRRLAEAEIVIAAR